MNQIEKSDINEETEEAKKRVKFMVEVFIHSVSLP